jgi:hypothetical protein
MSGKTATLQHISSSLSSSDMLSEQIQEARQLLQTKVLRRIPSLSSAEKVFLHALLVDDVDPSNSHDSYAREASEKTRLLQQAAKKLDDDVLFSIPDALLKSKLELKQNRRKYMLWNLWKAHEDGVNPKALVMRSSLHGVEDTQSDTTRPWMQQLSFEEQGDDIPSDEEVRKDDKDSCSSDSSWDEDTIRSDFSAWEILKDEYAKDFGHDYNRTETIADILNGNTSDHNAFKIIGTSADDTSAQPHVLSPPLMDALMSHLPSPLMNQNYWLKFSLIRDGASLVTLKMYCRASPNTILAIETNKGDVFGSFTSEAWGNHFGFFGSKPSFVWRMKKSRLTKCYSLFDQAALESQIDVFKYSGPADGMMQICRHDILAIGGDDHAPSLDEFDDLHELAKMTEKMGFALALSDDLITGTTSPSESFKSPGLCGAGDHTETFQVRNIEVWTFTPCIDVSTAEKIEMNKFFVTESIRRPSLDSSWTSSRSQFSSRDLDQEKFYRRVGNDPESEERRQRWQYMNMMHGTGTRGLAASPRFI